MSDLVVLCYHAVSDDWPDSLAVTPDQLRGQLEWLVARGYHGATLSESVRASAVRPTVVVTFDDAFRSVADLALPILTELGLPGTIFAVSDFCASGRRLAWPGITQWQDTSHASELEGLPWARLADLADAGWEVGSHTCSHPRLTQLTDEDLERELLTSRLACERALQRPCRSLAYPYGDVDDRVIAASRTAGYECAAALRSLPTRAGPLNRPRVGIYRRDTTGRFRLKVSPSVRSVLAAAGWAQERAAARADRRR